MLEDADFLADAKAQKLELTPLAGTDLQALISDTFNASADAIDTARHIMKP